MNKTLLDQPSGQGPDVLERSPEYRRLAKELRRQKRLGAVGALGFLALLVSGWNATEDSTTVKAQRFVLQGADSKELAVLNSTAGRPALSLFDENGQARIVVEVKEGGAAVTIRDAQGMNRLFGSVGDDGAGKLVLGDIDKNTYLGLLHQPDGLAGLVLQGGESEDPTIGLMHTPAEGTGLILGQSGWGQVRLPAVPEARTPCSDRDGKGRASLGASDEMVGLTINDHDEKGRVALAVGEDGDAMLSINDRDQKGRVALSVDSDGSPGLELAARGTKGGVNLEVRPDDSPILSLMGVDGLAQVQMELKPDGEAVALVAGRGKANQGRAMISVTPEGVPAILVNNKDQNGSLMLGPIPDGSIGLGIFDKNGSVRAALSVEKVGGTPSLHFLDAAGKAIYMAPPKPPRRPDVGRLDERSEPGRVGE